MSLHLILKKTELAINNNKFYDELVKIISENNILDKDEHPDQI